MHECKNIIQEKKILLSIFFFFESFYQNVKTKVFFFF